MRRVLFRADASGQIGTGHVMRCLALAHELHRRGWEVCFASRDLPGNLNALVRECGYPTWVLEDDSPQALQRMGQALGHDFEWLVLDHYQLDATWFCSAEALGGRRMVIDDLGNRALDCDLLVDSNLGVTRDKYAPYVREETRLLLGPRFVPMRPEFAQARHRQPPRQFGRVGSVLVSVGGADPHGATGTLVTWLREALPLAEIHAVVGPAAHLDDVAVEDDHVHIHRQVRDMTELILQADLAIGGGGTSAWERCLLGLPSLLLCLSDDQEDVAQRLAEVGAAQFLGRWGSLSRGAFVAAVQHLADRAEALQQMSVRAQALVDGKGAVRIAHQLEGVKMREAAPQDEQLLWEWANDPVTRLNSFSPEPIDRETHRKWFHRSLADPNRLQLIGVNGAGPVGQVRFDLADGVADLDISVAPGHRGGLGGVLLREALGYFGRRHAGIDLKARIKPENVPSRKIFAAAGFELVTQRADRVEMRLEKGRGNA